jgi:excisionase family DNA binding protein
MRTQAERIAPGGRFDGLSERAVSPARRPLAAADVMTAAEVAGLLHVSKSTVEDWARRGIVPSKKVGRRRLYIRSKIEALLLEDQAGSAA